MSLSLIQRGERDEHFLGTVPANPFSAYTQARPTAPVMAIPELDVWAIFRYDDVNRALTDHENFSSAPAKASRPNPSWLVFFDPPRHTRLRALISTAFTPRMVAALEPDIERIARELLDAGIERNAMDLVRDFAEPLPLRVIAGMIGLPAAEWPRLRRWSEVIIRTSSLAVGSPAEAPPQRPKLPLSAPK